MRITVIINERLPAEATAAALEALRREAAALGVEISVDAGGAPALRRGRASGGAAPDFYLALGGDGSVLRAVQRIHALGAPAPLAGVNIGSLGFLTCAGSGEIGRVLRALESGGYETSVRSMLECRCFSPDGAALCPPRHALNDAVALRGESGQTAAVALSVDGAPAAEFVCDGMIVATPTGSTAYALSAGGPIIMPDARALCVLAICPHSMTARPLVLPDTAVVELRVLRAHSPLSFSLDGQVEAALPPGARAVVKRSARKTALAMAPGETPFTAVARKLGWGRR